MAKVHKQNRIKKKGGSKEDVSRAQALQQANGFEWAGDWAAAERIYIDLIRKGDRDTVVYLQLAQIYIQSDRIPRALPLLSKLDQLNSYSAPICHRIGVLWHYCAQGRWGVRALEKAVALKPENLEYHYALGMALLDAASYQRALECFAKCIEGLPDNVPSMLRLGLALRGLDRLDEALEVMERAVDIDPHNVELLAGLAITYTDVSRIDDSIACWERSLEVDPTHSVAHLRLTSLRKNGHDIEEMEQQFAKAEKPIDRIYLAFGLGKAHTDTGNSDKAFHYLAEGNRLKRKEFAYSPEDMHAMFEKMKSIFTTEFLNSFPDAGVQDETPIFILGMPRSGSSLTEQILSSHPDVFGAGELRIMSTLCGETTHEGRTLRFPEHFQHYKDSDWRKMGEQYLAELRAKNPGVKHITDKMPQNFRYLGPISISLPRAKIIHCQRDPLDNCWSLYKNLFAEGHPFTYDLKELGGFYNDYRSLMRHWNEVLPGRIYNLNYERMVSNPETEIAALLEFCGLPFDQRCIDFHQSDRVVNTMSAAQVKRPMNADSIQAWGAFKEQLAPLSRVLMEYE